MAAAVAPPGLGAYGASKAATEALANTLRSEVAHRGVEIGVAYFSWLATDLVKTAGEHPAFAYMRTHLPGPIKTVSSADIAIEAIINGVLRRKRRVMAPGWLRLPLALRWFAAGNPAMFKPLMPEIERLCADEVKKNTALITDPARK